jgi:hypothetical protein
MGKLKYQGTSKDRFLLEAPKELYFLAFRPSKDCPLPSSKPTMATRESFSYHTSSL